MRKLYPSDISREQFEEIRSILESARKQTKPRTVDLYEIFCAVLYLLKSGCQWRMLPAEFPKWELVYYHFSAWKKEGENGEESALNRALKKMRWKGQKKQWSERTQHLFNR